jgi:hypothetical protein
MPVSPTGPISLPLSHLRVLLADCAAFRSWVGAADQAAALARIHLCELPPPAAAGPGYTDDELVALRPCAVIDLWTSPRGFGDEPQSWRRLGSPAGPFAEAGKLALNLIDNVAAGDADSLVDAKFAFLNDVGATISDLLDLAGTDGYLNVTSVEIYQGPGRADGKMLDTYGDHWLVQLLVHWGL